MIGLADLLLWKPKKTSRRPKGWRQKRRRQFLEDYAANPINSLTGRENYRLMKRGLKQREMEAAAQKIIDARAA